MKQLTATITATIVIAILVIWAVANVMRNTTEMNNAPDDRASILMTLIASSLIPFALAVYIAFRTFRKD